MIKILLNGCNGKMGKVVSQAVSNFKNLEIVAGVDKYPSVNSSYPIFDTIDHCNVDCDVILDFSRAAALSGLISYSKENNKPIVLCTTGYSEEDINLILQSSKDVAIFRSANMSIGINILSNVLKQIAPILYENYDIEIIEKHHNQKVDAPSGTALLLANSIKESLEDSIEFIYGREGNHKRDHKEIGIHAIRGGNIVGDHEVLFAGAGEVIELNHKAISREVFATGALKACEFIAGKAPGLYNMDHMLNLAKNL